MCTFMLITAVPSCPLQVSQLAWEGLTSRTAKWQSHRYVHVWRGRAYITSHRNDTEVNISKTYWMSYRVVVVPPAVRLIKHQEALRLVLLPAS